MMVNKEKRSVTKSYSNFPEDSSDRQKEADMSDTPFKYSEVTVPFQGANKTVPLPRTIDKAIKKTPLRRDDFIESSLSPLETHYGRFFHFKVDGAIDLNFSYSIGRSSDLGASDILTISPIQINEQIDEVLNSYTFQLPANVASNCITVTQDGNVVVVDMIMDTDILITLALNVNVFLGKQTLEMQNVYSWCKYSMPYSFVQRKPLLLKNLDQLNLLLSTMDGGLLLLSRTSIQADFVIRPFVTDSYFNSIKSKFFFGSKKSQAMISFDNFSVASSSYIDLLKITDDVFVTVSVDKKLAFWSLSHAAVLKEYQINDYLDRSLHSAVLSPLLPYSILGLSDNYITIFLSLDICYINIFKFSLDDFSIELVSQLTSPDYSNIWSPIDYIMKKNQDGSLLLWISWFFSNSSFYQSCLLANDENRTAYWSNCIPSMEYSDIKNSEFLSNLKELDEASDINKFSLRFIQSHYATETIQKALSIFNQNVSPSCKLHDLITQVRDLVEFNGKTVDGLKDDWVMFAGACQDIEMKTIGKVYSISFDVSNLSDDPFLIALKGLNYYSIVKSSSSFESLYFNSINKRKACVLQNFEDINTIELLKLVDLILDYSKGYNEKVVHEMTSDLLSFRDIENIASIMSKLFDKYIINIANEQIVSQLISQLSNIDDASELFNFLSGLLTNNSTGYIPNNSSSFTEICQKLIENSILQNNLVAKKIIFGLMLILLTLDYTEPIGALFSKLYGSFKYIAFLERVNLLAENDLVVRYITKLVPRVYIKNNTINMLNTYILGQLCNKNFVYFVVSSLVHSAQSQTGYEFLNFLPTESTITIILRGLIMLETGNGEEAEKLFGDNVAEITSYRAPENEVDSCEPISKVLSLILVDNPVDFFFNLTLIFETKKCYVQALELAIKASKSLTSHIEIGSDKEYEIYLKVFELALSLGEYELSFSSLKSMKHQYRIIPLRKFIYKLFQKNKLSLIIDFDYSDDLDRVDELIVGLGEEVLESGSGDAKLALKYFRVCYSLRLKDGDFRGAVESLYRFNSVVGCKLPNISEETYNILKTNYLVLINLLHTLPGGDQWIIRRSPQEVGERVVDLNEIEIEYDNFLQKQKSGKMLTM